MTCLYTIFFEFQGGTYIDQVKAIDAQEAMRKWAIQLPHEEIQGLGPKTKQHLIENIFDEEAVAVRGVANVWAFGIVFAGRFGMGTIIKTAL